MGNHTSHCKAVTSTGKVILPEGRIQALDHDNPMSVAEVMLENPQYMVIEFHPKASKSRPSPLPADFMLNPAKIYVLIPMRRRGAKIIVKEENSSEQGFRRKNSFSLATLMLMMRCVGDYDNDAIVSTNSLVVKNSGQTEWFDMEEEKVVMDEDNDMRADFLSRQPSSKRWTPNLDSIEEKVVVEVSNTNKFRSWLF